MSAIDTAAVLGPMAAGAKVTVIVQLPPAATELPQVFVWPKSPPFVPVTATLVMPKLAFPVLVKVTIWAALVVPTV